MPVENIHRGGSLMFNKNVDGGVIADCVTSLPGMIHEDDEFNEADLEKIKDKDPSVTKHWRYLSDSDAATKKEQQAEVERMEAEDEAARTGVPLAEGSFHDSTGPESKKSVVEHLAEEADELTPLVKQAAGVKDEVPVKETETPKKIPAKTDAPDKTDKTEE